MAIRRPKARNYRLSLDDETAKLQTALRRRVLKDKPKEPISLAQLRDQHDLSYRELALIIDARSGSHAYRLCTGDRRPLWDYACHIAGVLKGVVSLETLTER